MREQQDSIVKFYDFQPKQTVASIGAQCSHWEAMMASFTDNVQFYLEDIDTTYFKQSQSQFAWDYYGKLTGKPSTSSFHLVVGDEEETKLPDNTFDKIMIINSFHEFTQKAQMLADISTKLKPGGLLYIDEIIAKRHGQKHGGRHKPLLTEAEMVDVLKQNNYTYHSGMYVTYIKGRPYRKIYVFEKKD